MAGESRAASQVQFAIVVRARWLCLCRCEGRSASLFCVCKLVHWCTQDRVVASTVAPSSSMHHAMLYTAHWPASCLLSASAAASSGSSTAVGEAGVGAGTKGVLTLGD